MLFQRKRKPDAAQVGLATLSMARAASAGPAGAALPDPLPTRLNIGCGYDKRPDYLNIDMDAACQPDLLIVDNDLSALPRRHFISVLANDVLEHIPRSQTSQALLEWADLTAPSGEIQVSTSSILGVAEQMRDKTYADQYNWTKCLFGNQAHPGDFHLTGFTEATLKTQLLAAGFRPGEITLDDGWLFRVTAEKVEDWTQALEQECDPAGFAEVGFRSALGRDPEEMGVAWCVLELAAGRTRRELLKQLYASEERLYLTAARNGL